MINAFSAFYYGFTVDEMNNKLSFSEGGGELIATLNIGTYVTTELVTEVARAMTEAGTQEYSVFFGRGTRKISIGAPVAFELLPVSGTTSGQSVFPLLGFTTDRSGVTGYLGDETSGEAYYPQFKLQKYVSFDDYKQRAKSSVNKAATGEVEVVSFGLERFSEFNITFCTDLSQTPASPIENNPTGVADLRAFMDFASTKGKFEFIPDRDDFGVYFNVILESTPLSNDGTGYKLREMYSRGLANFFETGIIKLREINS